MSKLVPLEDLPPEARAQVTPEHPAFKAYASQFEKEYKLKPGTLTNAEFKFKPGTDYLGLLPAIAQDAAKSPPPADVKPREKIKVPTLDELNAEHLNEAGAFGRFKIGMGKSVSDTIQGIKQLFGRVDQSEVDDTARRDKAILDTTAGTVGNVLGTAAQATLPAGALARSATVLGRAAPVLGRVAANPYGNAALSGAAFSAAQPVETGSSRAGQAALGAATNLGGQAVGEGLGALTRAAAARATPAVQYLAERAKEFGIPLRAADVSPSPVLRGIQALSDAAPLSGGPAQREAAQAAFQRRLAKTMGEDTDDLLAALRQSRARNSQMYDLLNSRNTAELDPVKHGHKMLDAWRDFVRRDTSEPIQINGQLYKKDSAMLDDYLNNLFDPASGHGTLNPLTGKFELSGETYKQLRSEAGELARRAKAGTDPQGDRLHKFYKTVQQALDDAMRNSSTMTAADKAAYKKADKEWTNLRTLENIAPKDATGDFNFNQLANVLSGRNAANVYNRQAFVQGAGDQTLPDLARIGTTFLGRDAPSTRWGSVGKKVKELTPAGVGVGAAGGLYALNQHDHPQGAEAFTDTALELGGLGLASLVLGKGLNSRTLLEGMPKTNAVREALETAGLPSRLPMAAYLEQLRGAPVPERGPGE